MGWVLPSFRPRLELVVTRFDPIDSSDFGTVQTMKLQSRRSLLALSSVLIAGCVSQVCASTTTERLAESGVVLKEILSAPDQSIPQDLLDQAHCVVIVPGLKKGAFVVGAKYGRGFAVCRHADGRGWGAPAAVRVEGGSFGFQIGASETDLVLLVMNKRGMDKLLESKFTLGGAAEVAAGPVGRGSTAQTDTKMTAKILSYSRARGVFAGISLQGATLREDLDENEQLYGRKYSNRSILRDDVPKPAVESQLVSSLNRYSRREIKD
jgi:SH3 domain-containing YSC84-like protein 1